MRGLLLFVALSARLLSNGQCTLMMQVNTIPRCDGLQVNVMFLGTLATPPYQVNMMIGVDNVLTTGFDPWGYSYTHPWSGNTTIGNVDVAVYDAAGCQGTMPWSGTISRIETVPEWSTEVNCNTGQWTFRWTNADDACGSAGNHLILMGGNNGPVSNFCTQESPSVWRWTAPLIPPGFGFGLDYEIGTGQVGYSCTPTSLQCWTPQTQAVPFPYVQPGDCGVNVILRAALQGPMQGNGIMSIALRNAGLLPLTEPYSALGYTYTGTPSLTPAPAFYFTSWNIVDWIVVELRSALNPTAVVYSRPAFIFENGTIADKAFFVQGTGWFDPNINFPVTAGNYHIAIRHRNHLGIMTAAPIALQDEPSTLDFRLAATPTYGTDARVLVGGVWCLWAADVTRNGVLAYTGLGNDRDPILVAIGGGTPTSVLSGQYRLEDVNLDGVVKYTGANNDRDIILQNIGGSTPTNTRLEQLP